MERQGGLSLALQYNSDLFDAATAARLMDRFAVLLRSIAGSPDLAALGAADPPRGGAAPAPRAWNDTAGPGCEPNLFELFAAQAERTPEAVAVVVRGGAAHLPRAADRAVALAHRLVGLGVGPEVLVGVAAERSVELVAGLLAVLARRRRLRCRWSRACRRSAWR